MDIPIGSIFISRNKKESDNDQVPGYMNHISIYLGNNELIEAQEGPGVVKTTLDEYKKRDYNFLIRFPKDKEIGKKAAQEALKLLGSKYRFISSIFVILRRDKRGESCVSLARKAYYRAGGIDPKWGLPDTVWKDEIYLEGYHLLS